ncbi:dihydrofolate synthetase like protein [Verticillium longisporum]|nr:dihydrofolate synthetase like protein [Verticillium longisporum]
MKGVSLNLQRMARAMGSVSQSWEAIHVAGTNGKGVLAPLTEFELVTMTAFTAFDDATIDVGIVEVGLGGRLDSTNALRTKKVTVITKIGLDHQKMLGETLPEIAKEKAGIMMANVPCVVDGSNPPEVLEVFRQHALGVGAPLYLTTDYRDLLEELYQSEVMPHQAQNMACAIAAFRLAFPEVKLSVAEALPVMANALHRGRLSWLDVSRHFSSRKDKPFLVDGAHNPQSAGTLSAYVEKHTSKLERLQHSSITLRLVCNASAKITTQFWCFPEDLLVKKHAFPRPKAMPI